MSSPHDFAGKGLIEPDALAALIRTDPSVRVLDATLAPLGSSEDPHAAYERRHIPGARFFDIEAIADHDTDLPHMLPSAPAFETAVEALGISSGELIVIYDQGGLAMAAARAWWMFRAFGHHDVCVLNGGLPAWEARGFAVTDAPPPSAPRGAFSAELQPQFVRNGKEVLRAVQKGTATILDARAAERFAGEVPEPRPGLRAGHIPGSLNTPFMTLIDPQTRRMKDPAELQRIFADLPPSRPVITSCGSGVTACVLALGLYIAGQKAVAVYDGSWAEWGRPELCLPVALLA